MQFGPFRDNWNSHIAGIFLNLFCGASQFQALGTIATRHRFALVINLAQSPRLFHLGKEPVSQLMDAIFLAKVQCLFGQ